MEVMTRVVARYIFWMWPMYPMLGHFGFIFDLSNIVKHIA